MSVLWRLLSYTRPYAGRLLAASAMLILSGALVGVIVSTVKPLVNEVLLGPSPEVPSVESFRGPDILDSIRSWIPSDRISSWAREHAFVEVPLLLVLAYFIRSVLGYFGQYMTIQTGSLVIRDLRKDLYESVAYQSPGFFQAHPTGVILSRILNDVQIVRGVATVALANAIRVAARTAFLGRR